MTAAPHDGPPVGGWTTDDLDALHADGVRRELLDGVLHASPSPSSVHQVIAMRLGVILEQTCPDHLLYAKAGIPHFWLVEIEGGLTVQTYRLDPDDDVHRPSGTFTDVIDIDEPWRIEIPIAGLRPRNM